jgi:hypothetical protein
VTKSARLGLSQASLHPQLLKTQLKILEIIDEMKEVG